jgi:hypothetical protein
LRIDNLGCGTLLPPLASGFHRCRWIIQRRLLKASSNDSGHADIHSGHHGFSYRHHPGISIDYFPKSLSTSSRNPYRLRPETPIALLRITQKY